MDNIFPLLKSSVSIMIPVFFAAAGGLFPALAGTLNIALEGLLLVGAFSSLTVFYFTGNAAAGILAEIDVQGLRGNRNICSGCAGLVGVTVSVGKIIICGCISAAGDLLLMIVYCYGHAAGLGIRC